MLPLRSWCKLIRIILGGSNSKESACNEEDLGSVPGPGRSPGGGHDNPLQYSCLENPHGHRSLVGYSLWRCKQSDTTERLILTFYRSKIVEDLTFSRTWASFTLIVIHQRLNDTPTGTMVVPRLLIKGQKVGSRPIPGNLCPFSKIVGIILPLDSLGNCC